ncbi:MAG: hypothetical protein ACW98X_22420 [Promethearchaeota archaeon]|jgi:hypothetical protein
MKCEICRKENAKLRVKDLYYHKACLLESRKKGESSLKIEGGEDVNGDLDEENRGEEGWQTKLRIVLIFAIILGIVIGVISTLNNPIHMIWMIPLSIVASFGLIFVIIIVCIADTAIGRVMQ